MGYSAAMMRPIAALAALLFGVTPALAQQVVAPEHLEVTGAIEVDLSENRFGEQVLVGADVFYGVAEDLDVGLVHTSVERTGFLADQDGGICLGDAFCPDVYDSPGVLGRYQLLRGDLSAVAEAGLIVVTFTEPFALSAKLGFRGRWQSGPVFFALAPNLFIGLAGRTLSDMGAEVDFNTERLHVPLDIGFALAEGTELFVQLGVAGPLNNFVDGLNTPLGAGLTHELSETIELSAWYSFLNVVNTQPDLEVALDIRSGGVSGRFRF